MNKFPKRCALEGCQNLMYVPKSLMERKKFCCKEHASLSYRKGKERTCLWCNHTFYTSPGNLTRDRGKFCSHECRALYYGSLNTKKTTIICAWEPCSKKVKVLEWHIKNGNGKYCSQECYFLHKNSKRQELPEPKEIIMNDSVAWLTALIATDGCLSKDYKLIIINSKDKDLLEQCEEIVRNEITGRRYKISERKKGDATWWSYAFYSPKFYDYLITIGITPNKSLTIKEVILPDDFFPGSLRGCIDGDGSIEVRVMDGKEYLRVRMFSASEPFINWIHKKCKELIGVKGGGIHKYKTKDYWELSYSHYDSLKILYYIYPNAKHFLLRKKSVWQAYLNKKDK